jgi:hypothetical protein
VAALSKKLNAKKLRVGDRVDARVLQDVVVQGNVVIPHDSRLIGRVTDVEAVTKTDPQSRLGVVFESRVAKDGGALPMHGVIQALAPPLPDPYLETALSSPSPYDGGANGHPVNGGLMSTTQTNAPTEVVNRDHPRESGVRALEQRERALEGADQLEAAAAGPHGALTVRSRGVFGLPGLFLSEGTTVPAIVAAGQNVELKSGTQIVLRLDGSLP